MIKVLSSIFLLIVVIQSSFSISRSKFDQTCSVKDFFIDSGICSMAEQPSEQQIYILFDVNPVEGFNLRRDVYIRMATFLNYLRQQPGYKFVRLVLPPFDRLYHWRSRIDQANIFWNHFFDLDSMKRYTPVLDLWEFFDAQKPINSEPILDHVIQLKNFENFILENGHFVDKFQRAGNCDSDRSDYFGYKNLTTKSHLCFYYQGFASKLYDLFELLRIGQSRKMTSILIRNSEILLHDHWGDADFWRARRSMRFNQQLVEIGNRYRLKQFNSSDHFDAVQRPIDWRHERPYRKAVGGNYLCAHLRRADFLHGRKETCPTLRSAAGQIRRLLKEHNLSKVFISSDCSGQEYKDLKSHLSRYKVYRYHPDPEELAAIKDGGVAIIDQIICATARFFIGTFESTFTYRLYEEREILGFDKQSTFNTFFKNEDDCPTDDPDKCPKNSVWPIVY